MARALGSYPGCRWFKSDCRYHFYGPLVKRLRHRPFTAESWVRFPYGSPQSLAEKSARFLFYVYCRFCLLKCMAVFRKSCKAKSALSGFSVCRKTPICKQIGVKFMPNYAFAQKSRSITAKNEKNMCFLQLWIAYFLRFIAANLSLTQFVT